jgi:hypothetical protein
MVKIHGKEYYTVVERVNRLHDKTKGEYSLNTELVRYEGGIVIMKATLTFSGNTFTGHAYEKEGSTQINKTSALENCETSAIGRALASAGYGGTEFASANEVENAIHQQKAKPSQADWMGKNKLTSKQLIIINDLLAEIGSEDIEEKTQKWLLGYQSTKQGDTMINKLKGMINNG